jgi:two-component system, NtrC family, response regulator AtoC
VRAETTSSVVFIDENPSNLAKYRRSMGTGTWDVLLARDFKEVMQEATEKSVVAVFVDLESVGHETVSRMRELKVMSPGVPLALIGRKEAATEIVSFFRSGEVTQIEKPVTSRSLKQAVGMMTGRTNECAVDSNRLTHRPNSASDIEIIIESEYHQLINRISALDSTVLLTGESGTGKTTVARRIHELSNRSSHEFVVLNCGAIAPGLIESELFGHEKGAFTGADSRRIGHVETAEGGTLFLDEIGDLALPLQAKLLTLVQDRSWRRVGSSREHFSNIRFIAATNRDLRSMSAAGEFRSDLMFRLDVLGMQLPPLRESPLQLNRLISKTLCDLRVSMGRPTLNIPDETRNALLRHSWPGNIRELQNVLERTFALSETSKINEADLMRFNPGLQALSDNQTDGPKGRQNKWFERTFVEIERDALQLVIASCGGNKAEAARNLKISERGLYKKIKRLGIS